MDEIALLRLPKSRCKAQAVGNFLERSTVKSITMTLYGLKNFVSLWDYIE